MTAATSVPSASVASPAGRCSRPSETQNCGKPWAKVGGSVQRVHVPAEFAFHPVARALFAVHSVLWKGRRQPLADQLFRGPVGDGHQVHIALVLGLYAFCEELAQDGSSLAGNHRGRGNPHPIGIYRIAAHTVLSAASGEIASGRSVLARRIAGLPASVMVRIWCL